MIWPFDRHQHEWQEQSRVFVPPIGGFKAAQISEDTMLKLSAGYTSIASKCTLCGDYKTTEALGNHTKGVHNG